MSHLHRAGAAAAAAALFTAVLATAPAQAAPVKKPHLGDWTCGTDTVPAATLTLFKGNKYAANGDTAKAKYVYKAGQKKLKFKSGVWEGLYYGTYAPDTKTITLYNVADDSAFSDCTQPEA